MSGCNSGEIIYFVEEISLNICQEYGENCFGGDENNCESFGEIENECFQNGGISLGGYENNCDDLGRFESDDCYNEQSSFGGNEANCNSYEEFNGCNSGSRHDFILIGGWC